MTATLPPAAVEAAVRAVETHGFWLPPARNTIACRCGWESSDGAIYRPWDEYHTHFATVALISAMPLIREQIAREVATVKAVNQLLGVSLWDASSFRADVRIDFHEDGTVLGATLLNPAAHVHLWKIDPTTGRHPCDCGQELEDQT
jgi:hypothetical protein